MIEIMKYRFLKLSISIFILCFLTMPVNADLSDNKDILERRIIASADGSFNDALETIKDSKYSELTNSNENILLTNKQSKYGSLTVDKKTYYPENLIHYYGNEPKTRLINCEKKKFDNTKICYLKEGDVWVFLINGKYSVSIGSEHYPRSQAGLRIDNSQALFGYEGDFSKPLSIIEKLKKGKFAYTRYQQWPYQYNIDGEINLEGFNEKFNEMLKSYKEL